jgi:hypothetical protein
MPTHRRWSSGRCFAFIVNVKRHPDPFLVEMSRRTNLQRMTMRFYEPNILYCPPEMEPILVAILDKPELKSLREVVKVAMVSILKEKGDHQDTYEAAVEAILDSEIRKYVSSVLVIRPQDRFRRQ